MHREAKKRTKAIAAELGRSSSSHHLVPCCILGNRAQFDKHPDGVNDYANYNPSECYQDDELSCASTVVTCIEVMDSKKPQKNSKDDVHTATLSGLYDSYVLNWRIRRCCR